MTTASRVQLVTASLALAATFSVSPCKATPPHLGDGGEAPFGISLWADPNSYNPQGVLSVAVTVWGISNNAVVHVGLTPGLEVVKGDTVRSIPRGGDSGTWPEESTRWPLYLRHPQPGGATLTGSIRIQREDSTSYDIGQYVVDLAFDGKGMQVLSQRTTLEVTVRHGQRYRYGGMCPVPVDSDDVENPYDVNYSHAELLEGKPTECHECGLDSTINFRVLVTVGRDGRVTSIREPNPWVTNYWYGNAWKRQDARPFWPAVLDGVRRYKFRPANINGRTIADWATLTVQVIPKK